MCLEVKQTWVHVPALLLPGCVTLGWFFVLSVLSIFTSILRIITALVLTQGWKR